MVDKIKHHARKLAAVHPKHKVLTTGFLIIAVVHFIYPPLEIVLLTVISIAAVEAGS